MQTTNFSRTLFLMTVTLGLSLAGCHRPIPPGSGTGSRFAPFTPSDHLEEDFRNPPAEARPWCFWWWLEGNIDSAGIRRDLAAMKAVGIHTAIIYDAGSSSYVAVYRTPSGPPFMSRRFRDLFAYAVYVADSLDLQLSLNITSGWNDGGPWVTPRYASKRILWSVLRVKGPATLDRKLPLPGGVFRGGPDSAAYFTPVATLAVPLGDSSGKLTPLAYFAQKAVHNVRVPQTPNGYDWDIFLHEDSATLRQYSVKSSDILRISNRVDHHGHIHWQVPPGNYLIYWFGYTGTGSMVSTSGPGGEGLAIDYMDSAATDLQFAHVPGVLIDDLKKSTAHYREKDSTASLRYLHDDSWELGAANWTPGFMAAFKKLRGYDPATYLPVLAGQVVENKEISNRFLYDFRRTIGDLIAVNHYGRLRQLAHRYGLGIHPEGGGPHPAPIDALENLGMNDVPMGEFWAKVATHRVKDYERIFVKQSASAAHTYGRRYAQDEGPTSIGPQWEMDPRRLKPTIDRAFCEGMNRIVFHTFTHSPASAGMPGYEYFAGTHFNPQITWWKDAPAYAAYITRCQLMLQQGSFVGDVCFYYGNNVPNQVHLKRINPSLGEGYDDDVLDTRVLLDSTYVKNHRIYLKSGMHYEVLVMPDRKAMPLKVLQKIRRLIAQGATVISPRPVRSTGLSGYPASDSEVKQIAGEVWGSDKDAGERAFGQGKIVWGKTIRQVLAEKGIRPDVMVAGKKQLQDFDYIHRRFGDYNIYFLCNWRDSAQWFTAKFRVKGGAPSFWHPDDGRIIPQPVYTSYPDYTAVPVYLPAHGAVFVVFKKTPDRHSIHRISRGHQTLYPFKPGQKDTLNAFIPLTGNRLQVDSPGAYAIHFADGTQKTLKVPAAPAPVSLKGPWKVSFDTAWGGPGTVTFDNLISWPDSPDKGIRFYSGTAVYRKAFQLDPEDFGHQDRIILELGTLYNLADVTLNGKSLGVLWKDPFSCDVTSYVRPGTNHLEIKVVNLWPNRIIGDQSLAPARRYTHTNVIKFTAGYPLLPSGLLGPVSISFKPVINLF